MTNLTDRTMPGIKTVLWNRSDVPDKGKLCDFVKEYRHYDNITCLPETDFIIKYNNWAKEKGYRRSVKKAIFFYQQASSGIPAMPSETSSTQVLVLDAVKILRSADKTLISILTQMRNLASGLPEYETVISMHGIGKILAPRVAKIAALNKFLRIYYARVKELYSWSIRVLAPATKTDWFFYDA